VITGKYLDYARPAAPELRPADLNEIVRSAVDLVAKSAAKSRVSFETRIGAARPRVRADPAQIQQVLVNLFLNAAQVQPQGGRVEIETADAADGVAVTVRDRGPGLPDVPVERLYEPFYTNREGGTGLGLHVSRRIVRSHGGQLEAANAEGGGARFRLVLPRPDESAP
jgi:signal transduction histidine kinase